MFRNFLRSKCGLGLIVGVAPVSCTMRCSVSVELRVRDAEPIPSSKSPKSLSVSCPELSFAAPAVIDDRLRAEDADVADVFDDALRNDRDVVCEAMVDDDDCDSFCP